MVQRVDDQTAKLQPHPNDQSTYMPDESHALWLFFLDTCSGNAVWESHVNFPRDSRHHPSRSMPFTSPERHPEDLRLPFGEDPWKK